MASPSLKTPAIPPFYEIVATIKSTKLFHNLVFIRTRVTGSISYFRMASSMGWGRGARAVVRGSGTLFDGLMEVTWVV